MNLVASGKLCPQEWVEALLALAPAELDDEPFGPVLLVIRAPDDDDTGQFVTLLLASVMKEGAVTGENQRWPATSQFPTMRLEEAEVSDADQVELLSELASAPHCIVPVRSGAPGGGLLLGRAPHAELRLSDPSVSAEHARIIVEDEGVRLTDIGSKNGTTLNGRRLALGDAPWLQPMDRMTFGRIQAFVCAPRVLRSVLRQDLKTLA